MEDAKVLNILIVEDNFSMALELEMTCKKLGHNVLGIADNSGDALVEIHDKKPDLLLMDINIKGKLNGIEISEKVAHFQIPVIFITSLADEEHFNKATQIENSTYVTKPVSEYTLKGAISLIIKYSDAPIIPSFDSNDIKYQGGDLFLKKKDDFYRVPLYDIMFIKSSHVYCKTVTKSQGEFTNRISLNNFIAILKNHQFIKPHRSYLVNLKLIDRVNLNDNFIVMGDHTIPISRTIKKDIRDALLLIN